jgi:hypothetical protein
MSVFNVMQEDKLSRRASGVVLRVFILSLVQNGRITSRFLWLAPVGSQVVSCRGGRRFVMVCDGHAVDLSLSYAVELCRGPFVELKGM